MEINDDSNICFDVRSNEITIIDHLQSTKKSVDNSNRKYNLDNETSQPSILAYESNCESHDSDSKQERKCKSVSINGNDKAQEKNIDLNILDHDPERETNMLKVKFPYNNISNFFKMNALGDGNCLFRALSLTLFSTEDYHEDLRIRAVAYIRKEWNLIKNFVVQQISSDIHNKYCDNMEKMDSYGTTLECYAISYIFNVKITIYCTNSKVDQKCLLEPITIVNNNLDTSTALKTVFLHFSGDYDNGHFQALKPTPITEESKEIVTSEFVKEKDSRCIREEIPCINCGKLYSKRGMKNHIHKAHPQMGREMIQNRNTIEKESKKKEATEKCPKIDKNQVECTNEKIFKLSQRLQNISTLDSDAIKSEVESVFSSLIGILQEATVNLPGPKHPNAKFIQARKNNKQFKNNDSSYKKSSNPERTSKRNRSRRMEKYNYQKTQYLFYNSRKKCVNNIMIDNPANSTISLDRALAYFRDLWGRGNLCCGNTYKIVSAEEQESLDKSFETEITKEDVEDAIKKIRIDSSSGPDYILPKTIKTYTCAPILAACFSLMLEYNFLPEQMTEARTILIHKSGDTSDPTNFRPISICSIIRRIFEKILDKIMRSYIDINENQRGFQSTPGAHINVELVNQCLLDAKHLKKDLVVSMLDISKAFDNVGHEHLEETLQEGKLPSKLRNLVITSIRKNSTRIEIKGKKSEKIAIKRGVFQGLPLSPLLFNIGIDSIIRKIVEKNCHEGYILKQQEEPIIIAAFADDIAIFSNSDKNAIKDIKFIQNELDKIGLQISLEKSKAIRIKEGKLNEGSLDISEPGIKICCISEQDTIKYLGVNFKDKIIFNQTVFIKKFRDRLEKLISTPMLHPHQKLTILNQYIWPMVTYPFQMAPTDRIPASFLKDMDQMIRSTIKEILQLPNDVPNSMLYSPKELRGLGLVKATWESVLQKINTLKILSRSGNKHLSNIDYISKSEELLKKLNLDESHLNTKAHRKTLRQKEFHNWLELHHKGKGVVLFQEVPTANKWIFNNNRLTSSEWTTAIKMNANVAAVRAVPGRSPDNNLCRRCHREIETLGHVLGKCDYGSLLVTKRHNDIRAMIANALRLKAYEVHEEIHCLSTGDSTRRIDIIAFKNKNEGFIIDPTIRFERDSKQPEEINAEKQNIYEPCIPYLKEKYNIENLTVIGLFIGSRGTITHRFEDFRKKFGLGTALRDDIVMSVLKSSTNILHNHLYSRK